MVDGYIVEEDYMDDGASTWWWLGYKSSLRYESSPKYACWG